MADTHDADPVTLSMMAFRVFQVSFYAFFHLKRNSSMLSDDRFHSGIYLKLQLRNLEPTLVFKIFRVFKVSAVS